MDVWSSTLLMIDTGFSGFACVSENFIKFSHNYLKRNPSSSNSKIFFYDTIWAVAKHTTYVFGNGKAVSDRQCCFQMGPMSIILDVIPDAACKIPILLGRKFLSRFAAKISFENSKTCAEMEISYRNSKISIKIVNEKFSDFTFENFTKKIRRCFL